MRFISKLLLIGLTLFLSVPSTNAEASGASFSSFSLNNINNIGNDVTGDGYVTGSFPNLILTGTDNGSGTVWTTDTATVISGGTFTFNWNYGTADSSSKWDPAGYILGASLLPAYTTQLSSDSQLSSSGTTTLTLAAGQVFGFYVKTTDSTGGAGFINIAAVPEPETYGMMLVGLGLLGFMVRRKNSA